MNIDTPPQVMAMEMAVLGAAMLREGVADEVFKTLHPDLFGPRTHRIAWAVYELAKNSEPLGPEFVVEHLRMNKRLGSVEVGMVADMVTAGMEATFIGPQLAVLARINGQRQLEIFGRRVSEAAQTAEPEALIPWVQQELAQMAREMSTTTKTVTLDDILNGPLEPAIEWWVEGLLPKSDRLLCVAGEGHGKSTLLRQFALSHALGCNPLDVRVPEKPGRAMIIDCEVSRSQLSRGLMDMYRYAEPFAAVGGSAKNLAVESMQGGLDLCSPRDAGWLIRRVREFRPNIIALGPLYRMASDLEEEERTRCWQRVLEPLLEDGISLVMEHHSPHGTTGAKRDLRPYGSSAIRRWVSTGIALRLQECEAHGSEYCQVCGRVASVEHWRGSRDQQTWPSVLRSPRSAPWFACDLMGAGTILN